jgi:enolase
MKKVVPSAGVGDEALRPELAADEDALKALVTAIEKPEPNRASTYDRMDPASPNGSTR